MNHIALVIPTIDRIGGAERQVILLARGLRKRGWQISLIALSGTGGDALEALNSAGVSFLSLKMRKGLVDLRGWIRFQQWLRLNKPDIVHAHLPHAAWLARWSRLAGPSRALVDTLHSPATGSIGRKLGYHLSAWFPDKVTAVSLAVAEAWFSALNEERLIVIPNGVDIQSWKPNATARRDIRQALRISDEFLWLAVGRLEPVKDYRTMLLALAELPLDTRLVIAGVGQLECELRRLTSELNLDQRVRFLGFEPDVLRWMQAADGFVLSSLWEGLPMALLEASACALPAVVSDVPGVSEILEDGRNGLKFAPGNSKSLSIAMRELMQMSSAERELIGKRAQTRVEENFCLDRVLERWEALYRELLQANLVPRRFAK